MDGLFTGPGSERRRFLDRLILCFDPGYRTIAGRFERAMQQRNRLLADGVRDNARFEGLEMLMAETGVAIAAARAEAVAALATIMAERTARDPHSPFPAAGLALEGALEADLERVPAVEVEDTLRRSGCATGASATARRGARSMVRTAPICSSRMRRKPMPARLCSTGEQKALLIGLMLAHAELVARRRDGRADPAARRDRPRIWTPSGGRRCSRKSCVWAPRRG